MATSIKTESAFDAEAFLSAAGPGTKVLSVRPNATIHRQGSRADTVLYLQQGDVRLAVLSATGNAAIVGVLGLATFC